MELPGCFHWTGFGTVNDTGVRDPSTDKYRGKLFPGDRQCSGTRRLRNLLCLSSASELNHLALPDGFPQVCLRLLFRFERSHGLPFLYRIGTLAGGCLQREHELRWEKSMGSGIGGRCLQKLLLRRAPLGRKKAKTDAGAVR